MQKMSIESSENSHLKRARTIAGFQFGRGAGAAVFPDECTFKLSSTKRIRYIMLNKERLATVRAGDGRLTLSREGAKRLYSYLDAPSFRVTVLTEIEEFIIKGKNAMAKHVVSADPGIRSGDEVLVCNEEGDFLGTGSAILCGKEMAAFNYGVAVQIRKGS